MIILNYLTLWKLWCHNVWKKKCSCSWCNPLGFSILLFPINFFKYTYLDIIIILFCVGRRRVGGVTQFPLAMDNFGFFFGNQNFYHWHLKIMLILFLFNQLKSAAFLIWKAFYFWKEMSSPLLPLPSPPHIPFFLFLLLLPSFSLLSHLLRFNFFSTFLLFLSSPIFFGLTSSPPLPLLHPLIILCPVLSHVIKVNSKQLPVETLGHGLLSTCPFVLPFKPLSGSCWLETRVSILTQ